MVVLGQCRTWQTQVLRSDLRAQRLFGFTATDDRSEPVLADAAGSTGIGSLAPENTDQTKKDPRLNARTPGIPGSNRLCLSACIMKGEEIRKASTLTSAAPVSAVALSPASGDEPAGRLPPLVMQPNAERVTFENIDALNACDWDRVMYVQVIPFDSAGMKFKEE